MEHDKSTYADRVTYDESLDDLPTDEELETTVANLEERGFDVVVAETADEALSAVTSRIPTGASVMDGHSTTLEEIGFMGYVNYRTLLPRRSAPRSLRMGL